MAPSRMAGGAGKARGAGPSIFRYAGERMVYMMKKLVRGPLCLLLAAALLLGALPLAALAAEGSELTPGGVEISYGDDGSFGYEVNTENCDGPESEIVFENGAQSFAAPPASYEGGDMYSQLSKQQKLCYDALDAVEIDDLISSLPVIHNGKSYRRVLLNLPGVTGAAISGSLSGGAFIPSGKGAELNSSIQTDLCAAIVALRYDRPDVLWMDTLSYGYKVKQTGSSIYIESVHVDYFLKYNGREKEMRAQMLENARTIAAEAGAAADTYSKVKAVHDALAAANTYGDTKGEFSHSAYSALVAEDPYEPVCDGYAKAFKIVCGYLDIPCVLASSKTHMWNNVKMDDGEWYNLDLTWDDSGDKESYDYFLIGSQTESQSGGVTQPFSKQTDHVELNPFEEYRQKDPGLLKQTALGFPTKNKQSYEYLGQDYPPLRFPDVKRSAWYYDSIESAAQLGLFLGDEKGKFNPNSNITRAQFALVMANTMGADLSGYTTSSFSDVPAGQWYSAAVSWAEEQEIMVGSGGRFRPNANITRQELCVAISHVLSAEGGETVEPFPDEKKIASWAKTAVDRCKAAGLVQGDEKGNFNPLGITQRSSAAVVFTKLSELLSVQPEPNPEPEPEPEPEPAPEPAEGEGEPQPQP